MIYVLGGIKGGTGKTTVATHLAVMLALSGRDVLLVDADDQLSASSFSATRTEAQVEPTITTVQLFGKAIREQLLRQKAKYDDIVVDVGGRDTTSQRAALLVADIFLVPFVPRSYDLWTITQLESLIEEVKTVNEDLRVYCFLNRCDARGSYNAQAAAFLRESDQVEYIEQSLTSRNAFSVTSTSGLTAVEVRPRDRKACQEIEDFFQRVIGRPFVNRMADQQQVTDLGSTKTT